MKQTGSHLNKIVTYLFSDVIKKAFTGSISAPGRHPKRDETGLLLKAFTINQNREQEKAKTASTPWGHQAELSRSLEPGKEGGGQLRLFPKTTPVRWAALPHASAGRRCAVSQRGAHCRPGAHGPAQPQAAAPRAQAGRVLTGRRRRTSDSPSHCARRRDGAKRPRAPGGAAGSSAATRATQPPETRAPGVGPGPPSGHRAAG